MRDTATQRAKIYQFAMGTENDPRFHFIQAIKPKSKVLDIGCACGDLGAALQSTKEQIALYGMEYNAESIGIAMQTGAYEKIWQLDLNTSNLQEFAEHANSFDYIIFGDVLEHILYPQEVLQQFIQLLKPNGKLLLSLPNIAHASIKANLLVDNFDYTEIGLLDKTHIKFFTHKSIVTFLTAIHLKIEWCKVTVTDILGHQPTNPYPELSLSTKYFIFKDYHSFVVQYVMQVSWDNQELVALAKHNSEMLALDQHNAPQDLKKFRRRALRASFRNFLMFWRVGKAS